MTPQANASFLLDSFPNIWFMRIELPVRKSTLMCVRALYETVHGPCGTATAAVLKRGGATGFQFQQGARSLNVRVGSWGHCRNGQIFVGAAQQWQCHGAGLGAEA